MWLKRRRQAAKRSNRCPAPVWPESIRSNCPQRKLVRETKINTGTLLQFCVYLCVCMRRAETGTEIQLARQARASRHRGRYSPREQGIGIRPLEYTRRTVLSQIDVESPLTMREPVYYASRGTDASSRNACNRYTTTEQPGPREQHFNRPTHSRLAPTSCVIATPRRRAKEHEKSDRKRERERERDRRTSTISTAKRNSCGAGWPYTDRVLPKHVHARRVGAARKRRDAMQAS